MTKIPLVNLRPQMKHLEGKLWASFRRVLQSGQFILGPEVARFEREFASFCQARYAVGVASGTDALELSLRALRVGPGDGVITVSFTFISTVDAILHVGAEPLFVDIDPSTYTMDPQGLSRLLHRLGRSGRRRVKGILPVHLYGHPCRMDALREIARRYRLFIVEDAAQAAGARWKGRPVGSFGELGCFSFFPSKTLGGFGDGGMVVTRSLKLARQLRCLRVQGRGGSGQELFLGRNSRLDELQAALLRVKLKNLSRWVAQRQRLAAFYTRELGRLPGLICPASAPGATHAFSLYGIRVKERQRLWRHLTRQGIAAQAYYPVPVHRQPVHRSRWRGVHLPETERAAQEVLALPLFPELTRGEQMRICQAVSEACR